MRFAHLLVVVSLALATPALAGSLTPPGAPAPTMKSLDQVEPRTLDGEITEALFLISIGLVEDVSGLSRFSVAGLDVDFAGQRDHDLAAGGVVEVEVKLGLGGSKDRALDRYERRFEASLPLRRRDIEIFEDGLPVLGSHPHESHAASQAPAPSGLRALTHSEAHWPVTRSAELAWRRASEDIEAGTGIEPAYTALQAAA